jgi:hypothetical protein
MDNKLKVSTFTQGPLFDHPTSDKPWQILGTGKKHDQGIDTNATRGIENNT